MRSAQDKAVHAKYTRPGSITALTVKRLNDRAKSAWWLLVAILPVVGPLWLLLTLGIRAGTQGENRIATG